jgi:hypothetical protein
MFGTVNNVHGFGDEFHTKSARAGLEAFTECYKWMKYRLIRITELTAGSKRIRVHRTRRQRCFEEKDTCMLLLLDDCNLQTGSLTCKTKL